MSLCNGDNQFDVLDEIMYEIRHSPELGRYLVAAKDLDARTTIIWEKPLVSGPADDDRNMELGEIPVCLGCFKRMTCNSWSKCSKCGWPVCGPQCEIAESHAENECQVFINNNVAYPCRHVWPIVNKSILVLRTLLLKSKFPSKWQEVILKLEHHTKIRQTKPYCIKGDEMIVENLCDFLSECGYEFEKEVVRISGILNVNAFSSVKSRFYDSSVRIFQCIYPQCSLLAHSCIPNASWSIDDSADLRIAVCTTVPIKKGESISIAYNLPETMSGTLHRMISTEDVGHFVCGCKRCIDKTEAGTYISAIKCFDCESGYMLPETPTDPESTWTCDSDGCNSAQRVQKIVLFLNTIEEAYEEIKSRQYSKEIEIEELEIFIQQQGRLLHENHYILQEIRMKIIKSQIHSLESLNENDLDKFINHCKVMLKIADVLMPGFSKTRALLQFYLSQGLLHKLFKWRTPNGKLHKNGKLYQDIHCLQTRALLFFKNQTSSGSITDANQFVTCLKRQLQHLEDYT